MSMYVMRERLDSEEIEELIDCFERMKRHIYEGSLAIKSFFVEDKKKYN